MIQQCGLTDIRATDDSHHPTPLFSHSPAPIPGLAFPPRPTSPPDAGLSRLPRPHTADSASDSAREKIADDRSLTLRLPYIPAVPHPEPDTTLATASSHQSCHWVTPTRPLIEAIRLLPAALSLGHESSATAPTSASRVSASIESRCRPPLLRSLSPRIRQEDRSLSLAIAASEWPLTTSARRRLRRLRQRLGIVRKRRTPPPSQ